MPFKWAWKWPAGFGLACVVLFFASHMNQWCVGSDEEFTRGVFERFWCWLSGNELSFDKFIFTGALIWLIGLGIENRHRFTSTEKAIDDELRRIRQNR